MNPLLSKIFGTEPEVGQRASVHEDVPVPCAALPRKTFRDRLERERRERQSRAVRGVVGEAANNPEEPIIPDDAEELDAAGEPFQKNLKSVKDVVLEPRDPYGEKEKPMTPTSALVAPDATPEAMTPLDPSKAPAGKSVNSFKTSDADSEPAPSQPDMARRAMDVLMGRSAPNAEPSPAVTAESAYSALSIPSPAAQAIQEAIGNGSPEALAGVPMPGHAHTDGQQVLSAFHRFVAA